MQNQNPFLRFFVLLLLLWHFFGKQWYKEIPEGVVAYRYSRENKTIQSVTFGPSWVIPNKEPIRLFQTKKVYQHIQQVTCFTSRKRLMYVPCLTVAYQFKIFQRGDVFSEEHLLFQDMSETLSYQVWVELRVRTMFQMTCDVLSSSLGNNSVAFSELIWPKWKEEETRNKENWPISMRQIFLSDFLPFPGTTYSFPDNEERNEEVWTILQNLQDKMQMVEKTAKIQEDEKNKYQREQEEHGKKEEKRHNYLKEKVKQLQVVIEKEKEKEKNEWTESFSLLETQMDKWRRSVDQKGEELTQWIQKKLESIREEVEKKKSVTEKRSETKEEQNSLEETKDEKKGKGWYLFEEYASFFPPFS